jgi:hypothetical protein
LVDKLYPDGPNWALELRQLAENCREVERGCRLPPRLPTVQGPFSFKARDLRRASCIVSSPSAASPSAPFGARRDLDNGNGVSHFQVVSPLLRPCPLPDAVLSDILAMDAVVNTAAEVCDAVDASVTDSLLNVWGRLKAHFLSLQPPRRSTSTVDATTLTDVLGTAEDAVVASTTTGEDEGTETHNVFATPVDDTVEIREPPPLQVHYGNLEALAARVDDGVSLQQGGQEPVEGLDGSSGLWTVAEDGITPIQLPGQMVVPIGPLETREDWEMMADPRYNRVYYHNVVTGESTWTEPPGWDTMQ